MACLVALVRLFFGGGGPVTPKPLNRLPKNLASVITSNSRPDVQNLVTIRSKGAWLRMREIRH